MQAFTDSDATEMVLGPAAFEGSHLSLVPEMQSNALLRNESLHGIAQQLYQRDAFQYVLTWLLLLPPLIGEATNLSAELCQSVKQYCLVGLVGRTMVASLPDKVILLHNAYKVSGSAASRSYSHTMPLCRLCGKAAVMYRQSQKLSFRAGVTERRVSQ